MFWKNLILLMANVFYAQPIPELGSFKKMIKKPSVIIAPLVYYNAAAEETMQVNLKNIVKVFRGVLAYKKNIVKIHFQNRSLP
jgi:hypothetical protein